MFDTRRGNGSSDRAVSESAASETSPGKVTLTQRLRRGPSIDAIADAVVQRLARGSSSGAPLPGPVRGRFEQSLGTDLGGVRVHSGGDAADAASAAGARAFALGQDVYFGSGNYDPDSDAGQHLLAHEVAHTVQQRDAEPTPQFALEVSQSGDAAEVEAESVAGAMVQGIAAPRLTRGPVQRIARDPVAGTPATAVAPGMAVPSMDVILEQIAHRMVYSSTLSDSDQEDLRRWGYRPTAISHLPGDLSLLALPSARAGVAPILAFKGTLEAVDWIEDMNSYGVGMFQFSRNEGLIHLALASLHGGATVTGHSLGGALAQICTAIYPELVSTLVTFQAPGIPQELIDGMLSRPEGRRVTARHHVMTGDVVSHAGEGHIPGTRYTHTTTEDAIDPATAHRMMPLSQEASDAGVMHDITGGTETWNYDTPRHASAVSAVDTEESSTWWAEAGRAVGSGLAGDVDEELYVQVWTEVRAAADAGTARWPELWSMCERVDDRAEAMRQNIQDLFPELSCAGAEEARVTGGELTTAESFVAAVAARRGGTLTERQTTRLRAYFDLIPGRPEPRVASPEREAGPMRLARGSVTPVDPSGIAARGVSGGGGALPHLDAIQTSFGRHDVSGVSAHQGGAASDAARSLDAHAYAFGGSVAFDGAPDLHTAAHEAAHVVQQRGGIQLRGSMDEPGDVHEVHADAVADAVVRGESAEALLDTYAGGAGAGGVQRLVAASGPEAASTVQRLIMTASPDELSALRVELDRIITEAHSVGVSGVIGAVIGGETYQLTLSIDDARILRESCGTERAAAAGPTPAPADSTTRRGSRTHHVHGEVVTDMRDAFRHIMADALIAGAGAVGEAAQIEATIRVPIEGIYIMGHMQIEAEHETEGWHVVARPQIGIGIGGDVRGTLIGGITLDARGHDALATMDLVGLGIEQELRAMAAGPPPPFVAGMLGALIIVAPEFAAALAALDLLGRGYNWFTTGEANDPFILMLVNAIYGESYDRDARARMRAGEFVETSDAMSVEGHAETGGRDGVTAEGEVGMSRHRRTARREDGPARDEHFDLWDFRLEVDIASHVRVIIEFHLERGGTHGNVDLRIGGRGHVSPATMLAASTAGAIAEQFNLARTAHEEAHHMRSVDWDAAWGALASGARTLLGAAAIEAGAPVEAGLEFRLVVPMNITERPRACVRLTDELEGETHVHIPGAGAAAPLEGGYEHAREVWTVF